MWLRASSHKKYKTVKNNYRKIKLLDKYVELGLMTDEEAKSISLSEAGRLQVSNKSM